MIQWQPPLSLILCQTRAAVPTAGSEKPAANSEVIQLLPFPEFFLHLKSSIQRRPALRVQLGRQGLAEHYASTMGRFPHQQACARRIHHQKFDVGRSHMSTNDSFP